MACVSMVSMTLGSFRRRSIHLDNYAWFINGVQPCSLTAVTSAPRDKKKDTVSGDRKEEFCPSDSCDGHWPLSRRPAMSSMIVPSSSAQQGIPQYISIIHARRVLVCPSPHLGLSHSGETHTPCHLFCCCWILYVCVFVCVCVL